MNDNELTQFRKNASLESMGESSEKILDTIVHLIQKTNLSGNIKVLDIGCGTGKLISKIKEIIPQAECHGCDYSRFEENKDFHFFQHDRNLEFPKNIGQFDLIVSSEVIEHIENGRHFIRQIKNLLKPNGTLVLSTPNTESLTSLISYFFRGYHTAFGPRNYPAHINSFSEFELKNILNENSLKMQECLYINNGRIPGTALQWHSLLPFLSGKRFSDNFVIVAKN